MSKFSEDFLIGAATAAHQVEGNNIHSDYWAMEQMTYTSFAEPSLDTCDHYNRYEEDIKMLAEAGLNAYRFSIEWARIEPECGVFDEKELAHYEAVIDCCRDNGVEPIVTLMHFTSPKWLISQGGWENPETVDYFARYAKYVAEGIGSKLNYVCTINEANMGLQVAAIAERYKRQMMAGSQAKDAAEKTEGSVQVGLNMSKMMENMRKQAEESAAVFGTPQPQTFVSARTPEGDILVMKAHLAAKEALKAVCPDVKVGLSLSLHDIQPAEGCQDAAIKEWEEEFKHYIPYIKDDDYFGLQNYTRSIIDENGIAPVPEGAPTTQMDYENYPQALEHVIRRADEEFKAAGRSDMPIIVTENGIAVDDDSQRVEFIDVATDGVANCIADGIDVRGYMYWSLMDNFEWQKGYVMTFGLISVDRSTQTRSPKPSLAHLGQI